MNRIKSIRKILAFFLLVVFALSATPKVVFHEVLAEHQDGFVCQDRDTSAPHLHQPAFHCFFDDLVASSPYVSVELQGAPEPPVFYYKASCRLFTITISSFFLKQNSRGPPVA